MHEPLSDPLDLGAPGIMTGSMMGEQRRHAGVPVTEPHRCVVPGLILNVETPAGGADIGTGSAVDAGKCHLIPEWGLIQIQNGFTGQLVRG